MRNLLFFLFIMGWATAGMASENDFQSVHYRGSRAPLEFDLRTEVTRTEYRRVQVPYTERVCRNETRYRQECRMEPGRRICRTVTVPICRNQRVCRTLPNGRRQCQNRRVCRNERRQECRTEPGRRVCRQVPYNHRVCRNETRYRWETRPVTVVDRYVEARVTFNLESRDSRGPLDVVLEGSLYRDALTINSRDTSSERHVVLSRQTYDRRQSGRTTYINVQENGEVVPERDYFSAVSREARAMGLRAGLLQMRMPVIHDSNETYFGLTITSIHGQIFRRELTPHEITFQRDQQGDIAQVRLDQLLGPRYHQYRGTEIMVDLNVQIRPSKRVLNMSQFQPNQFNRLTRFGIFLD